MSENKDVESADEVNSELEADVLSEQDLETVSGGAVQITPVIPFK